MELKQAELKQVEPCGEHIVGALQADGRFAGRLRQYGCRGNHPIRFAGRLIDDNIEAEFYTSASGNLPELAAKRLSCTLPLNEGGSFGDCEGEESRFWLRYRPSGGPKYQWLSGRVTEGRIFFRLTFGSPEFSTSYCRAEGWFESASDS